MHAFTLLIVDKTGNGLGLNAELEKRHEFPVALFPSMDDALQNIEERMVYGVLVGYEDIKGMNPSTIERLRKQTFNPNCPVFVIADHLAPPERLTVFQLGITDLLIRPFNMDELFFRLDEYLSRFFLGMGQTKRIQAMDQFANFYGTLDSLDSQVICQRMQNFVNQQLGVQWVSIWWYEKKSSRLVLGIHSSPEFPVKYVEEEEGHLMWSSLQKEKHLIFESQIVDEERQFSKTHRSGIAMVVPMIADGVWLGVINFTNFAPAFFQSYSLDDLVEMGARVTSRLGHALNHEKTSQQEHELSEKNAQLEELNDELQQFLQIQETISTNLLQTSQELNQSKQRLEELSQMKDEFLAIASHDLRSPLGGIRMAVETILSIFDVEEDVRDMLTPVLGLCNDQMLLVTELLDVAKLEAGKMVPDYEELSTDDFNNLLMDQGQNLEILARVKNIELILKVESSLPPIFMDILKIKQVLHNLVGNAIKFTNDGGKIQLSAKPVDEEWVQFTVSDNGVGIKPENIGMVFNKYEQVKDRKLGTKGERGSGLGLAICKNLIELHHGQIWVESIWGNGSDFHFKIPCQPPS